MTNNKIEQSREVLTMNGYEVGYFETLIREDHKFGKSNYVMGVITGWADLIFEDCFHTTWMLNENWPGKKFGVMCSWRDYERFAHKVEERYPGLCVFDCKNLYKAKRFIVEL